MDELNQWYYLRPFQESDQDDLAHIMYQEEQNPGMQQQHAEPPPQHCTPSVPPTEPNPFRPSDPQYSSSFPRFEGPALPNMSFAAVAKQEAQQSSSSMLSFSGQQATMLTFAGGGALPDAIEGVPPAPERRIQAHCNTREHVVAERKRLEKMQQQFTALASIVPDLTKSDKITLLDSTIKYVKQLEKKVNTLGSEDARRTYVSTSFETKCNITTDKNDSISCQSVVASGSSPTIEATVHGDTILLKIFYKGRRGVLVTIISQLENQGMSIINTNVLPFGDMFLNITITAKIGEWYSTTDELVTNLTKVLRSFI